MLNSSESRRRKKDPDRDRDASKSKDKDREKARKSKTRKASSTTSKESDRHKVKDREHSSREQVKTPSLHSSKSTKTMSAVPEMERRASLGDPNGSRISLPYPSFSKAHSKESVLSRDSLAERKKSPLTPEPTDLGQSTPEKSKGNATSGRTQSPHNGGAPPSPPLTATTAADLRKQASTNSMRRTTEALHKEMERGRASVDSGTRVTTQVLSHAARSSVREGGFGIDGTDLTTTTDTSQPSTIRQHEKAPRLATPTARQASPANPRSLGGTASPSTVQPRGASEVTQSTDSTATSTATARQKSHLQPTQSPTESEVSPASIVDSSPRTPTQHSVLPSVLSSQPPVDPSRKETPAIEILGDPTSRSQSIEPTFADSLPPPPPPPPPIPTVVEAPRVDYLLQNGGLPHPIPRSILATIDGTPVMSYSAYASPRVSGSQAHDVRALFAPIQKLLDDYTNVMSRNGSLAVATGYRSVARRLLDRLEAVFARNISSEHCKCIMCVGRPIAEDEAGVNWGEILELVSGRCDLPNWPPFDSNPVNGLGISELEAPCQRLDVDVPEEYRAHYQQQSRKTKLAVQSWLSNQQETAPEEADDETLTFAMLTRLEQDKRPLFYALLYDLKNLPGPRFQPPADVPVPEVITKAALALQRLYRLYALPRAQIVVAYLIRNPNMHAVLATLAAVKKSEWEILVSGRFDGFLWSGAENTSPFQQIGSPPPAAPPRGPVAGDPYAANGSYFPFSPGPASRPGSRFGQQNGPAPVQLDEETEVAVLAEIEREIYLGMEALEDAFEHLHNSAEVVRRRLRERGAALSMVAQARRGYASGGIEVRMDTPASFRPDLDAETLDELRSEILPDDSASNVSHARRRRPARRERRTPAPVEEEDEPVVVVENHRRRGSGAHRKTSYAH